MAAGTDYYKVLGVSKTSSEDDIKKVRNTLRPRRGGGGGEAAFHTWACWNTPRSGLWAPQTLTQSAVPSSGVPEACDETPPGQEPREQSSRREEGAPGRLDA